MIDMDDNEFGVLLRPVLSDDDDKYGNVEVSVFSNLMPAIDDEVHAQYMFLAYKMAALLQFCEDNPDVDDRLDQYTNDLVKELGLMEEEERELRPKPKITGKNGNVITLDFGTKCGGNG